MHIHPPTNLIIRHAHTRQQVRGPGGLEGRMAALEAEARNARAQLEVAAALQDRQAALAAALEETVRGSGCSMVSLCTSSGYRADLGAGAERR